MHETDAITRRRRKHVAEAHSTAQRAKLDDQAESREQEEIEATLPPPSKGPKGKRDQRDSLASRRASTTMASAIEDYLQDHAGSNHSAKTLEWHSFATSIF